MNNVERVKEITDDSKLSRYKKMQAMSELVSFNDVLEWYKQSAQDKNSDSLAISQLENIQSDYAQDYANEMAAGDDW